MKQKGRRGVLVERGGTANLFLCLFLILINCTAAQPSLSDRAALLALRSSLGLRAKDWPLKANPCTNWTGVSCQLGRVTRIIVSGLRRTRIGRQRPQFSVDSLANLTALVSFNATGFSLPGSIPDWIGSRVGSLEVLDLRSCGISGAIPGSLGRLRRLKELHLSDNSLTGNLNPFLGQLQSLSVLDLSENFLTGSIPDEFSALTNLTTLDLASNFISGPIPTSLASISALRRLNLSYNSLTSAIPTQLSNLSHLVTLDISKNSISGPISLNLIEFKNLKEIRIGENGLNGEIPENLFSDLSQLTELQIFDASSNNLTGKLPNLNINVTNSVFNFSNNQLYGPIDASWLQMPGSIDLSGNYFQGPISVQANVASLSMNCLQNLTNQRSSTDCRSFYSNQGLVFDEFGSHQPDEPPRTSSGSRNKSWVYVVIGACGAFGVMVVLALLVFIMRRRNTTSDAGPTTAREIPGTPKHPMTLVLPTGDSFTYQQILHATSNFSDLTFIKHGHSGELYQGLLDNRAPVVVKKVASDSLYVAELEFFGRVSHARLVPLLGHCVGAENEKFLVYKYMPNGDLASSFYRPSDNEDDSLRSIDWITRLKIAIGAAEGLAYLHHECSPPIVHRDIQASSILLDDKFEVRLGSLSEIRASDGDPQHGGIKRFLRKQSGTLDQTPTGLSPVACSYDVYCFGKVLLELVTGKIGIGKSDDSALKEWIEHSLTYISVYDKELVTKIIDPSLIVDEDLLEEVWAMAIVARSCLNPKPSKRPLTKYILRALENPLKVVRAESIGSSSRLRTNSSTRSWNAAFLGSWRHSSSDSGLAAGPSRQPARVRSHSSSGNDHSSSNKRLSSEIFPEPISMPDMDRIDH